MYNYISLLSIPFIVNEVIMIIKRDSDFDRRSGIDRRLHYDLDYFFFGGIERRSPFDRRSDVERRFGWLKISKYSSVYMSAADEINISCYPG